MSVPTTSLRNDDESGVSSSCRPDYNDVRLRSSSCEILNRVFIRQHRSLLQYADLCYPWVDSEKSRERITLRELAAQQREKLRDVVRLLDKNGWAVDYGQFPESWADLNFVSLDFLWPQIVNNEKDLLAELHEIAQDLPDDDAAVLAVSECIGVQREILRGLQQVSTH